MEGFYTHTIESLKDSLRTITQDLSERSRLESLLEDVSFETEVVRMRDDLTDLICRFESLQLYLSGDFTKEDFLSATPNTRQRLIDLFSKEVEDSEKKVNTARAIEESMIVFLENNDGVIDCVLEEKGKFVRLSEIAAPFIFYKHN